MSEGIEMNIDVGRRAVTAGVDGSEHDVRAPFGYDPFANRPGISEEKQQALDERLAGHLAGWAHKHPDVPVRRVPAPGRPAPCALEQTQLVVLGWHGQGGARRAGPRPGRQRPLPPRTLPGGPHPDEGRVRR
jgi:hypothetical protein